jgi:3',5'-cyclic AMP phosphodiesterase CpdA
MFRLAHLSDPHLGPLPEPALLQLLSKRILGYVNWRRNRHKAMGSDYLAGLVEDMLASAPDHIALTGDLVNIALPLEIEAAKLWLEAVATPERMSLVPGNHDAYVPGALKAAFKAWRPYMAGDHPAEPDDINSIKAHFPYLRQRGQLALIGVSTARASAPGLATGRIGVPQTRRLLDMLEETGKQGLFRVVMIHHPPFKSATRWHKRLEDASRLRAAVKRAGAELVLHGHTHIDSLTSIEGPNGSVPVIGVPSASHAPGGKKPGARYNLFSITRSDGIWRCTMQERGFLHAGEGVCTVAERQITIPAGR